MPGEEQPTFDVALSFAGPDRPRARALAEALRARDLTVFTDDDRAESWGEYLPDFLFDLYHRRARRCVVLLSASYSERQYTEWERKAAQARDLKQRGYLLPVRLDGAPVPGPLEFVGFVDWPPESAESIAELVAQKLAGSRAAGPAAVAPSNSPGLAVDDVIAKPEEDHLALDVRIRNAGHEVLNVTRADVHVLSRDEMLSSYQPSATYGLMMKDEHNVIGVGHVLKPGEVDALVLEVGYTSRCRGEAEVILHYNGDRTARSRKFPFRTWR